MESRELLEWMAYFTLEPWGQVQEDLRAGVVASMVANASMGSGKAIQPGDIFPLYDLNKIRRPGQKADGRAMFEKFKQMATRSKE